MTRYGNSLMSRTILLAAAVFLVPLFLHAQVPPRVENTTLTFPSNIFSSVAYETEELISTNTLGNAVGMASAPGETNRLFVIDRLGRIIVIPDLNNPVPQVFLDITNRVKTIGLQEQGLLGLAFHPDYASNRYFYVFYTGYKDPVETMGHRDTVARFQTTVGDPNVADDTSEMLMIQQDGDLWAHNHNAGDMHFGPDGYLYIAFGDGGIMSTAQDVTNGFFSAVARIDVDNLPGSLPPNPHPAVTGGYSIPPDNPYIGLTNFNGQAVDPATVRTEFWAVGFRNPWRFSIDSVTGDIYLGDVGEDSWEEVNLVQKGANYGWPYKEGTNDFSGTPPAGMVLTPPIAAVPWGGGDRSVIGGFVYRGTRLTELYGRYVFTDWGSGMIRALLPEGTNAVPYETLTPTFGFGPTAMAPHPGNGDILICYQGDPSVILRVVRNDAASTNELPATLSDTGAFADLATLTPSAGIIPYDINLPFWSDHAIKTRWFSIPDLSLDMEFAAEDSWTFPTSAVWVKHFEIEMTNGVPSSRRNLETRFLVRNEGGVYGVTYRWAPGATNATLVAEEGFEEDLIIDRGGTIVTQRWSYPARSDCLTCHTPRGGWALGFNTAQLNMERQYGAVTTNQIMALSDAGYFTSTPGDVHSWLALASPDDNSVSREFRVRSYLQANCSQCHGDGGVAGWDAWVYPPLSQTAIVDGPLNRIMGNPSNRVVAPGDTVHSMLLSRISNGGGNRMPPIGSSVLDTQNIALVTAWIGELSGYQTFADWQIANFGSTTSLLAQADADPDGDGLSNEGEWLTSTSPTNSAEVWKIDDITVSNNVPIIHFQQLPERGFDVLWRTNLLGLEPWQRLNVPDNQPFFSSVTFTNTVRDTSDEPGGRKYYRVRVYEK